MKAVCVVIDAGGSIQETFRLKKEAIKYKNSHPNQFLIIKPIYIY